ncbi:hypothetical protein [Corynebacterium neomassiliense]|uniref:hypothetical protein n=1 Tax=Corynebacterium neomassiliense TaxID=2079482 RepID=UPI00103199A3|nr:hypothetical protein [Corynebacterium neomassiliense]
MSQLTWTDIAATILADMRGMYPNARKPDPAITQAWATALARSRRTYPAAVWREAVTVWAVSHSEPPTPHDIIVSAGQVIDGWQSDPRRSAELETFRNANLRAREARGELPVGTAPESPSDGQPVAIEEAMGKHAVGRKAWENLRAELRRRREAEAAAEKAARLDAERAAMGTAEGAA